MVDDLIFAYFATEMLIKMVKHDLVFHFFKQKNKIRSLWEYLEKVATSQRAGISSTALLS